jgi:uncharacterized protein with GYD domain
MPGQVGQVAVRIGVWIMPNFLVQVGYTAASWAAQMKNPQDVRERVQPTAEAVGGRLVSVFYAFGEHDLVAIAEFPNDTAAAAWAIGVNAGGALRSFKTTPLISVEDGIQALRDASNVAEIYRPPT